MSLKLQLLKRYLFHYWGNQVIYNLPYPLLIRAREYVLTNVMKNKIDKYN